jgi:hypothetical protein
MLLIVIGIVVPFFRVACRVTDVVFTSWFPNAIVVGVKVTD